MNQIAIIYQSNYGTTEQYASWIAEQLKADLYKIKDIDPKQLKDYDTIIYGGPQFGGNVSGIEKFKKLITQLKEKHIIIFTTGLTDPNDKDKITSFQKELEKQLYEGVTFFYLHGSIDCSKLNLMHKLMLKAARSILKKDIHTDPNDPFLKGENVNYLNKNNILPLLEYVQQIK